MKLPDNPTDAQIEELNNRQSFVRDAMPDSWLSYAEELEEAAEVLWADHSNGLLVKQRFDSKLLIGYTQTEMVNQINQIHNELIREALRLIRNDRGVEITTMGDIPSEGSGLGSSSTVTVAALHAMDSYLGEIVPAERLAREACTIEIDTLKRPIGIQDQYIAAYGGLRFLEFLPDGQVTEEKIKLTPEAQRVLNNNFMLFFTGVSRNSSSF